MDVGCRKTEHVMKRCLSVWTLVAGMASLTVFSGGGALAGDINDVLKLVPADVPLAGVFVNLEELDQTGIAIQKQMDPTAPAESMLTDIKKEVPVSDWFDFSKPIAICLVEPTDNDPVFWVAAKDFADKAKQANGTKSDGVWHLLIDETDLYAKVHGDYVVITSSMERLAKVEMKEGQNLAKAMASRGDLFRGRDLLLHINMEAYRSVVLQQIAQMAPMIQMVAMMSAQQGGAGADPTQIMNMLNALQESVQEFAKQLDQLDISVGLTQQYVDATIATTYKAGAIKSYLAKIKPAGVNLLGELPDQPYFLAFAQHVPGDDCAFMEYLARKLFASTAGADPAAMNEAIELSIETYRLLEGASMLMTFSPEGIQMCGSYISKSPDKLMGLTKKSLTNANSVMQQFSGGVTYESLGPENVAGTSVEMFKMKMATPPMGDPSTSPIDPEKLRFALGIKKGKLTYAVGDKQGIEKAFSQTPSKFLKDNAAARSLVEALPQNRNAVVLIDILGFMPIMQSMMMGMPPSASPAPASAPPIAMSVSLSGEPARLDIRVPIQTIVEINKMEGPAGGPGYGPQ